MQSKSRITTTDWPFPQLFAHRGGGRLAPENTLAAMQTARTYGYQAVEFDVKLSLDGVAMLMHDDTIDRTTNGTGAFATKSAAELSRLDAGAWHSPSFVGERVPLFAEVAHFLIEAQILANVEIKPCPGRESETGREVARLCKTLWAGSRQKPLLSSFSALALAAAREASPQAMLSYIVETPDESHWRLLDDLGCVAYECDHRAVTADWISRVHLSGRRACAYTVNDPERVRELLALGTDGLFTDALDAIPAR